MRAFCELMILGVVLPLLLLPAGPADAQTKTYAPKNKRFTIEMPAGQRSGQRTQIVTINKIKVPIESSYVEITKAGPKYVAGSIGIPATVMREIPADRRFDTIRDALLKPIRGNITAESDLRQGALAGKDYQVDSPFGPARMQVYMQGGFVFYAIVEAKMRDDVGSNRSDDFFGSFKMTPEIAEGKAPDKGQAGNPNPAPKPGPGPDAAKNPGRMTAEEVEKKLQGTWEVVSSESNGAPMPPALIRAAPTVTFNGRDFRWGDGQTGKIVAINANQQPIAIDYLYTSGPRKGDTDQAIITFNGDTFTDCMPPPRGDRPNQFTSPPGSGQVVMNYQRTNTERGPGALMNPWFYVGICAAVGFGLLLLIVVIVCLVLWVFRKPGEPAKPSRRRKSRRDDDDDDDDDD